MSDELFAEGVGHGGNDVADLRAGHGTDGATNLRAGSSAVHPALGTAERTKVRVLLTAIFLVSVGSLIYELLIATLSSYLIGSSVTQFSLSIGAFIGAMGVGSYVSQYVKTDVLRSFLVIELVLGGVGGFAAWGLYAVYISGAGGYYFALYFWLLAIGILTGLELPLLTRLIGGYSSLRTTLAQALSLDYVGALVGSVLFPLVLLPLLGIERTGLLVGAINVSVAAYGIALFRDQITGVRRLLTAAGLLIVALGCGFASSSRVSAWFEQNLYRDTIVLSKQTRYQHIVVTRWRDDLRLYIDGSLQFSSQDEYRYHESLVLPAMALAPSHEDVLIVGGGDGLALREVLKNPGVARVTLVDIDKTMTDTTSSFPAIVALNHHAFQDRRVHVVNADAYKYLEEGIGERYGVIVVDLPDPEHEGVAKLYSREFYRLTRHALARGGILVTQSTSPYFARSAFWCIDATMRSAGYHVTPYHVYVPSFGDWGFVAGSVDACPPIAAAKVTVPTRFLTQATLRSSVGFDRDTAGVSVVPSTLDQPVILRYYVNGARRWE